MSDISAIRHTLAHLLAQAVLEDYPKAILTLGPAIDNGFYYDIDFGDDKISDDQLKGFQKTMRKSLSKWTEFTHEVVSKDEALKRFEGNPYKTELINEIADRGETITLYTCGGFTDLCRGGHAENPAKEIDSDSFKLDRVAGAYWRGDEKNKMLTRIYGLAFENKEALDAFIVQREEAIKRDHRKLGAEMKLFTSSSLVGAGLPLMQPNGMIIRKEIEDYLWNLHKHKGYSRVWTPHLAKEDLYITSGHAAKFGDELFRVSGKEEKFFMKPMNCPHHMQIFADNQFSYRDMPVRYFEPATVYRDEKSGQLGGLTRVRAITQDDGHLFCRVSQINQEVSSIVSIIKEFYTTMGMMDGYWVSLSVRDADKSKYLGSDEVWNTAESALEEAAKSNRLNYRRVEGEATFYGPKLDFMFRDAIGRQWQLATIQCDFNLPERFDLSYINEQGEKERPVVIHRAISGSLERFMGVMIEHFAGAFPLWMAPVQVRVLPVSEKHSEYATQITKALQQSDIRADMQDTDSLGKRIRGVKIGKVPYYIVVGDEEVNAHTVTIENREGIKKTEAIEPFIEKLKRDIASRAL